MINFRNVHIGFSSKNVLIHIAHLELKKGCCYALIGKNGSGKSTLLKTLCGLINPLEGEITLDNMPLKEYSRSQTSSLIAFLPSQVYFPAQHTIESFVSLGLGQKNRFFSSLSAKEKNELHEVLDKMNLLELKYTSIQNLSDGQKQRAVLAQMMIRKCSYILLDEPLSHLDHETKIEVLEHFIRIAKQENVCVVFSTHDQYYLNDSFQLLTIKNKELIV